MFVRMIAAIALSVPSFALSARPAQEQCQRDCAGSKTEESWIRREIRFDDLDLTSTSGQKKLKLRVRHAITDVCLEGTGQGGREAVFAMMRCNQSAWRSAQPDVQKAINGAIERKTAGSAAASTKFAIRQPQLSAAPPQ